MLDNMTKSEKPQLDQRIKIHNKKRHKKNPGIYNV